MRSPRMLPFSILDRYILVEFLRYYVLAIIGFTGFVLLFDAFEKLDTFIDYEASPLLIVNYYWHTLPYRALLVGPVAPLLATFLCLGGMTKWGEITTIKATGISLVRAFLPLYGAGVFIAGLNFAVAEGIMPQANHRAREIFQTEIKGGATKNLGSRLNVNYLGQENRLFVIHRFDVARATMVEPMVQEFEGERLVRRLDAAKAFYRDGEWVFVEGMERTFTALDKEIASPFDTLAVVFPEAPEDFAKDQTRPDEMSFPELQRYADRVRQSGSNADSYHTDLHLRVAFPFANLVVILIASSLAVQVRRGGVALGFALSLALAFAFWIMIRAGQVLGHNGTLPPLLAAWLGDLIFLVVGLYMLYRTPK